MDTINLQGDGTVRKGPLSALVLGAALLALPAGVHGQTATPQASTSVKLTDEQQQALNEYFAKNAKVLDLVGKPAELLKDPKHAEFLQRYADALLVVRVGNALADANDVGAAKLVLEKLGAEAVKKMAPGLAGAIGWVKMVQTGMELFKDNVFDPKLEQASLDIYFNNRKALEPADAIANVRAWGTVRELALKRMLKEYKPELILEKGSKDKLLPKWEERLQKYVNAYFESMYQKKLLADARKEMEAKKKAAQKTLGDFNQKLTSVLKEASKVKKPRGKSLLDRAIELSEDLAKP